MSNPEELLAFYNVENLFDAFAQSQNVDKLLPPFNTTSWTSERLTHKLEQIGDALAGIHNKTPMLVGLAEVENKDLLQQLCGTSALSHTPYKSLHFESQDKRAMHCALLYDSEKLQLISTENLQVLLENEPDFTTRDIGYAQLKLEESCSLHVFVNHWSSRRDGQESTEHRRMQAAKIVAQKVAVIHRQAPKDKILIMGDLNDEPGDESIELLLVKSESTGVALQNLMADKTAGTLVRHRKWLLFDQMIVSKNLIEGDGWLVKNATAEIYDNPELLHTYPNGDTKPNATFAGITYHGGFSDHLPVYLILEKSE